jgi:glycosyltransferase involved in cell wall biosynthesis
VTAASEDRRRLRVAFVEPYFGGSHRAFAEGYARVSRHDLRLFTHPAQFWKWRMQGAHETLAASFEAVVRREGPFDVVMASSMLDLARFLGTARRSVGAAPALLYMHENQLTYPPSPADEFDMSYAMANWASMCAADRVLFNSAFHESAWFDALPGFLGRLPDQRHGGLIDAVRARVEVVPVGVDLARLDAVERLRRDRPLLLWNQRWDHDKDPEEFAAAVFALDARGIAFDLALAGERFVSDPTGFTALRERLGSRVVWFGYADDGEYVRLLRSADVVASTALQEFFGVAVSEAVYAGAFPVLPDRLVYPERIPADHHGACLYADRADLVDKLGWALTHRTEAAAVAGDLKPVMGRCDWSLVGPVLDRNVEDLAGA